MATKQSNTTMLPITPPVIWTPPTVIVILGILAAVIIPNVTSFIKKGTIAAADTELAQVGTAGQAAALSF